MPDRSGERERVSGVAYDEVGTEYFEVRGLRRYAGVGSLWALGVGAVISGDFFGWQFGLAAGGFGGLLAATVVITALYAGLCFSIAEMCAALPHTGGAYSFARSAMGPWGGYVTGLAENMEYILTPAVIVVGIGSYLGGLTGTPDSSAPWWWLGTYAVFVGLNAAGVEATFRFTVFITGVALAILAVFYASAIPHFDVAHTYMPGNDPWFPHGAAGVLGALPFAIWFYLAIEQLPLAAEEAHAPERDLPRGLVLGLLTLVVCSFATLVLSAGVAPGAAALGHSQEPLLENLRAIFGEGAGAKLLGLAAVAGLVASFHTIVFAYGRQIFSLSRAGYFPRWLSVTHGRRQTPQRALCVGAALGYAVALAIHRYGRGHPVGAVLINLAVFGAVISYALQMISFLLLRWRLPEIERPYRSPLGVPGAAIALAIALVTLWALFASDPVYRRVALGALLWYALGLAYFALWGRHRLVRAPEEDFALRVSQRGGASPYNAAMTDPVADLLAFLDRSPTPYHAVAECIRRLEGAGFRALEARDAWELGAGDRRYATRGEGSLVAFEVGQLAVAEGGFRWIGAHTDSPNLRVRPRPDETAHGYRRLGVELYGGVLLHTWLDRDLSLAGRAVLRGPDGPRTVLVDFGRPLLRIPNLAIHLQREIAAEGLRLNPQAHAIPVLGLEGAPPLPELLAHELRAGGVACRAEDVLSYDLMAYDTQPAVVSGAQGEFIQAARLDNLASCHAGLHALVRAVRAGPAAATRGLVFYDHEEVGSRSASGALGPLLAETLERIATGAKDAPRDALPRALARSVLVSADMAHAVHPSFADKHDAAHRPQIGAGPVIKHNANQSYASDAHTSGLFADLCRRAGVTPQYFVSRNDVACGSTIGPISAARVGLPTVDVGNPMLSMHSCREMAGAADVAPMIDVLALFLTEGGG